MAILTTRSQTLIPLVLILSCIGTSLTAQTTQPAQTAPTRDRQPAWVWWEGERPERTNFPDRTWFSARAGETRHLSEGAWLTNMGKRGADEAPAFATYKLHVPKAGRYNLWTRKFWKHGPFKWRFDDGPWRTCGRDVALADSVTLRTHVVANWVHLGELRLDAGAHTFELKLTAKPGEKKTAAFDAFVLMPAEMPFFPNGKLKPGARSGKTEPGHFAYEPGPDAFDDAAVLDLRRLNEETAGMHGWVRRDGDMFRLGDGEPVRFWAVNVSRDNTAQNRASIDYLARRLAKLGVNMVRFHAGLFTAESGYRELDDAALDDLCYLIAAMKREGIYTATSVYFPLWVDARGAAHLEGYDTIDNNKPFGLVFFEPAMQRLHHGWLRQLMRTRNPYTGRTLANEPALAAVELVNEDSLFFWTFQRKHMPARYWRKLERKFGQWLIERYGGLAQARRQWGGAAHERDAPDAGRAAVHNIWHLTRAGLKHAGAAKRKRLADQARFLTTVQRRYYAKTTRLLTQQLGYQGLVVCGNWHTADPVTLGALERYTYTAGDIIDRHGYFSGAHDGEGSSYSVRTGHTFTNKSGLRHPESLPIQTNQLAGFPQIISELNWPQPNRYRGEMTAMVAAYGALQGVDGLFLFSMDSNYTRATGMTKFQLASPEVVATFPAAALLYRQRLVREAKPAVWQKLALDDLYSLKGEAIAQAQALDKLRNREGRVPDHDKYPPTSFYVGPVVRSLDEVDHIASDTPFSEPANVGRYITDQTVRSRTRELRLNHQRGVLRIDTPRAKGAIGFLGDEGTVTLDRLAISCENEYASILVVPLDGKPIVQSRKLLVQAMTEDRPYGFDRKARPDGTRTVTSLGGYPFNVKAIRARVSIASSHDAAPRVTVLNENGYPRDVSIDVQRTDAGATFTLAPDGIYHVVQW